MEYIYIVTEGCYSDYRVICSFDKEEDANKYAEIFGCDVEKIEHNSFDASNIPDGYKSYVCQMNISGDTGRVRRYTPDGKNFLCDKHRMNPFANFYLLARDETHCIKIANEIRTMLIASGVWKTSNDVFEFGKGFTVITE